MDEIWKDVVGFSEYYKVSNKGNVKSFHNGERLLKFGYNTMGYPNKGN